MGEAQESLPVAGGGAGSRRGCQSHMNLQFSCSFFLQGEGTPNGRLCERAGRGDVLGAAWRALESALRGGLRSLMELAGGLRPEGL